MRSEIVIFPGICINKLRHDKSKKVTCAPSNDADQPGHPLSLIRVFAVSKEVA